MPNALWRRLMALPTAPKNTIRLDKPLLKRPFTIAFTSEGEWVASLEGKKGFEDFPDTAKVLNIVHRNNKSSVVKRGND